VEYDAATGDEQQFQKKVREARFEFGGPLNSASGYAA
jgi:hypothetical protein